MPRIVHLGLGNFHRAHQARYTQAAGGGWRITGVAMRSPAVRDAMAATGGAYDLGILGSDGLRIERISVHDRLLVAAAEPEAVLSALAAPDVAAVTLTVTEKGYGLRPEGRLDLEAEAIREDLATDAPRSAVGLLAHALARRHADAMPPLTILSCDNLSGNGRLLRGAVGDFLDAAMLPAAALEGARFPDSMVDRITPATTEETAALMAVAAGRPVDAPVLTESFTEWVIEDAAAGPLPDWAAAGARIVRDVAPFERRKLLLLNGVHSMLAYGGLLGGHTFVHEAIADPARLAQARALCSEAASLLPEFGDAERAAYQDALIARFSVEGMAHRLDQIAQDGSAKLAQRVLPVLRHHRFDSPAASRTLAQWWRVLERRAQDGRTLDDPAEAELLGAIRSGGAETARFTRALAALGIAPGEVPEGWAEATLAGVPE